MMSPDWRAYRQIGFGNHDGFVIIIIVAVVVAVVQIKWEWWNVEVGSVEVGADTATTLDVSHRTYITRTRSCCAVLLLYY